MTVESAPSVVKHWRSFGREEWRHVQDGVVGLVLGSILPVLLFYATYRAVSFLASVVVVLVWLTLVFAWHRRRTRGGVDIFSAATFAFACLQALIGLLSRDTFFYLATPSFENLVYGATFLGSALAGRLLLALYARRLYPVPPAVQRSETFQHIFLVVSAVWFMGLLARAVLRIVLLLSLPLEVYLVANTVAGWPFSAALVGFTVWYPLRRLRQAGLLVREPRLAHLEEAIEEATPGAP